jgi:uncharacterized damage-inducible protein DinB
MSLLTLPAADEYAPYYGRYIARLDGSDVLALLVSQAASTAKLLAATSETLAMHRYAEGKWSVKEVIGHLADGERIFAYRALRFARNDATELPGFEENAYVPEGRFDLRTLKSLAAEFAAVRASTLALFRGLDETALLRRGTANGVGVSVRALAAIIAGHEHHHVGLLRERYGLKG